TLTPIEQIANDLEQLRFELEASACNQARLQISRYARELVSKSGVVDDTFQRNKYLIETRLERGVDGAGIDRGLMKVLQSIEEKFIAQLERFGSIFRRQVDRHIVAKPAAAHLLRQKSAFKSGIVIFASRRYELRPEHLKGFR